MPLWPHQLALAGTLLIQFLSVSVLEMSVTKRVINAFAFAMLHKFLVEVLECNSALHAAYFGL